MAMPDALMERKAQRGTNRACSGMVATEHCRTQYKGFDGGRNTLAGFGIGGVTSLELFSCSVSLCVLTCYRTYDRFPMDEVKG